jgi:hypothetical protein
MTFAITMLLGASLAFAQGTAGGAGTTDQSAKSSTSGKKAHKKAHKGGKKGKKNSNAATTTAQPK